MTFDIIVKNYENKEEEELDERLFEKVKEICKIY